MMNTTRTLCLAAAGALALAACTRSCPPTSGNPVFPGWYADPEAAVFENRYWIYPTFSDYPDSVDRATVADLHRTTEAIHGNYNIQTFFDAFSSDDLVHWTRHPRVLSIDDVAWARYALWAPAILQANGRYYLFFGANDIQNNDQTGGIGVAVADRPEGPFKDALGRPLIGQIVHGAQPIDQFVFRDDDGTHYMYYGGWRHCNMVRLSDDLLHLVPFDDGELYKEVTPERYVEGPFMFKRGGKYYFMWSEGGWTGPDYCVAYAIADSPFGPFERIGKILEQDAAVATGAGHHSVIRVPDSDEWYIVYHRRPLGETAGDHREVCIDRMLFDEQGHILPVQMTFTGVAPRPIGR